MPEADVSRYQTYKSLGTGELYDFDIVRAPLKGQVAVLDREEEIETGLDGIFVPDNDGHIRHVATVSPNFQLIPHSQAVRWIEDALEIDGIKVKVLKTVLPTPARMFREYQLSDIQTEVKKGDLVTPRLTLSNGLGRGSNGLSYALRIEVGFYRLVCLNGMVAWESGEAFRQIHLGNDMVARCSESIRAAIASADAASQFWSQLKDIQVLPEKGLKIIEGAVEKGALSKRYADKVAEKWNEPDEYDKGRTLWSLYNAFTAVISHEVRSYTRTRKFEFGVAGYLHEEFASQPKAA